MEHALDVWGAFALSFAFTYLMLAFCILCEAQEYMHCVVVCRGMIVYDCASLHSVRSVASGGNCHPYFVSYQQEPAPPEPG
jgi:hypothetical protein